MSYTKDFLESKSQQYPEILKMTDEEALRYLDFMGELVESVDDSPTDIDYGYNLGGRVGFVGGGSDSGVAGGGFGMGVGPDSVGGNPSGTGDTSSSLGGPSNDNGKDPGNTGVSADDTAEDVYGISPNLAKAEEAQKDRFSPDRDKGLGIVNAFKTLSPTLNALRALGFLKDRVESFFGYNAGEDPGNLGLSYSPNPNNTNLGMTPIGTDVSPSSDPDRGGRADERVENVLDTELPMEMMFGGDPLKIATYQRYIEAGYPEDQARAIADSLMTNYTV